MKITFDFQAILWTNVKAYCPICKRNFTSWYCPSCGLPKKNSKYALTEYGSLQNCAHYHFRPEFSSFENFQLCSECYTTIPSNAKYCRNCGKKITSSQGISQDAHGWVDLGLSVLWATEIIKGLYMWNYARKFSCMTDQDEIDYCCNQKDREQKDVATQIWGKKWRTPTKEEFEELVIKCKWEKCLDPITKNHALKAIGPNGNSIIIPVTGYAGCNIIHDFFRRKTSIVENEAIYSSCRLWTSTEDEKKKDCAYAFCFTGYKEFKRTLTAREIKEREFENEKINRDIASLFKGLDYERAKKEIREEEEKRDEERRILNAMGDDRQERADNIKKDEERRRNLWLDTPVEMYYNEIKPHRNTIRPFKKDCGYAILPVADKKWQGKL